MIEYHARGRGREKKEEIYEDLKINARGTIKFCKTTRWKVADNFGFPGSFLSTPLKNGRVTVVGGTKKGRVKPLLYKIFDASHGGLPAWQSLITFKVADFARINPPYYTASLQPSSAIRPLLPPFACLGPVHISSSPLISERATG